MLDLHQFISMEILTVYIYIDSIKAILGAAVSAVVGIIIILLLIILGLFMIISILLVKQRRYVMPYAALQWYCIQMGWFYIKLIDIFT